MKGFQFFVCLLPLVASSNSGEPVQNVISFLQSTLDSLIVSNLSKGQPIENAVDGDTKLNTAYKIMINKLLQEIPEKYEMRMASMGNLDGALYVKDISIFGANNTYLGFDAPGLSYDIENLTLAIPYLHIFADRYIMNNLDLMGLITLKGDGKMELYLEDLFLEVKLNVKFKSLKFVVEHVPRLKIHLGSVKVGFENIGGEGERLSEFLNSLFEDVLRWIVQAFHNDIQNVINDPVLYPPIEEKLNQLFTTVLNTLKSSI